MDARTSDILLPSEHVLPVEAEDTYVRGDRPSINVADILQILRRDWRFPLYGLLIGLIIGVGYIAVAKIPYKSSARLFIDMSMNRYLQTNKIIDQPTINETEIGSQLYLLSSDDVVLPVVRSMGLDRDGEFAPQTGSTELDPQRERAAVDAVLKRLTVVREDVANVISVTFESVDARKAANIANAIADAYIAITAKAKLGSTKVVSQWLSERLAELRRQVAAADRALQEYRKANNLPDDGAGTQNSDLLSNLKIQLANARLAVAEARERLDRIRGATGAEITVAMETDVLINPARTGVINFALNNTEIVRLRAQYRELEARANEVEARVGPKHQVAIKLRGQLDALRAAIQREEKRIADTYLSEYQIAMARESEIAASVARLSGETEAGGQLRELEGAADTLHKLYDAFMQKYTEMEATQAETMPVQIAHIISRAAPPLHRSVKKVAAVFAGSLMLGLFLGAGAAVGREWAADVFRTPQAVKQITEIGCISLPMLKSKSGSIEEHILVAPYSRFAEAFRDIKASIDLAGSRGGAKVIGVVSSVPNEGKTVVAANLAALMTVSSGARTLIIDSDFHRRKLTDALAPGAREGLVEALDDPSRLAALVVAKKHSKLDILPCGTKSRVPNAAELLGSPEMERLLSFARRSYDYIIIEIAPIMSVVDVKLIERFVDGFVFVIEWGRTRRALVRDAMSDARVIRDRLIAVVLNKIDPVAFRSIESYKGANSGDYYEA